MDRWRLGFLVLFLACAGMLAFALYHQVYHWVMPCLMCVYQRLAVIAYGLLALLAVAWRPRSRAGLLLLGGSLAGSALFGAWAAALNLQLQYGPPDPTAACAASLPFPIDLNDPAWPAWFAMLIRPVGDCSAVDFTLFGVSVPLWVMLAMSGMLIAAIWLCMLRWRGLGGQRP
ncbi:disulfide bond formation protein B [Chitiniphilus purpureus]|uniref:Disulfide bond formation protein B n=1 Tax=Chitiniphilus purpureus TaxID=2981137 RepID=A0ABY6DIV9_9NEIS|nr:disulfide bond formation protein B [Chitiniphilus sp. CD1]UXY14262.1 disulfide bond formation protein B [Chitiniphilus sp. CD1]